MFDLLGIFKKKKSEEEAKKEPPKEEGSGDSSDEDDDSGEEGEEKEKKESSGGDGGVEKLKIEVDRINVAVESFGEVRKSLTDRLTQMSEQIGELRAMILDRDKTMQSIELKAMKAADLVEAVQPDKFMTELRKSEAKFEALKANMEGNEAIVDRIMEELREVRRKIEFFRGIEEIIKLAEETKKELIDIKKVEANISIETDKAQTFYSEIRKKYGDIDGF